MFRKLAYAKHLYAGFRYHVIVLDRAATYPYGPNENPILIDDWQSARERNQPVIGVLEAVKRFARLGQLPQLAGGHAKETCGLCLLDRNIDAPDPGIVHTEEGFWIGARIDTRDARMCLERDRFLAFGLDGLLGILQIDVHARLLMMHAGNPFADFYLSLRPQGAKDEFHRPLQIGSGPGGGTGWSFLYLTRIGSRVSFGQNFGAPISFKQEAFQYSPARDGDRRAATACATASMSSDSG